MTRAARIAEKERLDAIRPMPRQSRLDLLSALHSQALDDDQAVIRARRAALLADVDWWAQTHGADEP